MHNKGEHLRKEKKNKKKRLTIQFFYLANTFFKGFFTHSEKYVSPKISKQALTMGSQAEFWSIFFTNGIIYNQQNTWSAKTLGIPWSLTEAEFPLIQIYGAKLSSLPYPVEFQVFNNVLRTPLIHTKHTYKIGNLVSLAFHHFL